MSTIPELQSIEGANSAAVQNLSSVIKTFSDISGVVSLISFVVNAVGNSTSLQEIQNEITIVYNQLNEHQKAQDIATRLTSIDFQMADALGVLDGLAADVKGNLSQGERNQRIETCAKVLEALKDRVWYAPFQDQVYWNDFPDFGSWTNPPCYGYCQSFDDSIAPEPDGTGNVFSYIYVLPSYLRALTIFLTVGVALDPNYLATYGPTVLRLRLSYCSNCTIRLSARALSHCHQCPVLAPDQNLGWRCLLLFNGLEITWS